MEEVWNGEVSSGFQGHDWGCPSKVVDGDIRVPAVGDSSDFLCPTLTSTSGPKCSQSTFAVRVVVLGVHVQYSALAHAPIHLQTMVNQRRVTHVTIASVQLLCIPIPRHYLQLPNPFWFKPDPACDVIHCGPAMTTL